MSLYFFVYLCNKELVDYYYNKISEFFEKIALHSSYEQIWSSADYSLRHKKNKDLIESYEAKLCEHALLEKTATNNRLVQVQTMPMVVKTAARG